jgi:hypothetical protein
MTLAMRGKPVAFIISATDGQRYCVADIPFLASMDLACA